MSLPAIRERYGVPAFRHARVEFEGRPAMIASGPGHHLRLFFQDAPGDGSQGPFHPLWHMDYLDGVDHGARYDARVDALLPGATSGAQSEPTHGQKKDSADAA